MINNDKRDYTNRQSPCSNHDNSMKEQPHPRKTPNKPAVQRVIFYRRRALVWISIRLLTCFTKRIP